MIVLRQKEFVGVSRLARIAKEEAIKASHPFISQKSLEKMVKNRTAELRAQWPGMSNKEAKKYLSDKKNWMKGAREYITDLQNARQYGRKTGSNYNFMSSLGSHERDLLDRLVPDMKKRLDVEAIEYAKNYGKSFGKAHRSLLPSTSKREITKGEFLRDVSTPDYRKADNEAGRLYGNWKNVNGKGLKRIWDYPQKPTITIKDRSRADDIYKNWVRSASQQLRN